MGVGHSFVTDKLFRNHPQAIGFNVVRTPDRSRGYSSPFFVAIEPESFLCPDRIVLQFQPLNPMDTDKNSVDIPAKIYVLCKYQDSFVNPKYAYVVNRDEIYIVDQAIDQLYHRNNFFSRYYTLLEPTFQVSVVAE